VTSENPQENSSAPSEQRPTDEHSNRSQAEVFSRRTESEPPVAKHHYHKPCKAEKHWLDYATFVVEIFGLGGLGIYAALTYGIYCASHRAAQAAHDTLTEIQKQYPEIVKSAGAARDSADTARQSLDSVERAYVVFDNIRFATVEETLSGQKNVLQFNARWQNSGNTPASPAIQKFSAESLDRDEPNEEQFAGKEKTYVSFPIRPRAFQDGGFISIPESEIMESQTVVPPKKFFVAWGWLFYRDVLPGTDPHLTEFCMKLNGIGEQHKAAHLVNSAPALGWAGCTHHNCVDRYCKDYDKMVTLLPKK